MEIVLVKIKELKKNAENPRIIKDDRFKKLVKSIQDFPEMMNLRPIVIDAYNVILGGNQRYEACKSLGWKEVPTIKAESLTEDEKKQFIIADNAHYGDWDWDKLANDWDDSLLAEWGVNIPLMTTLDELDEDVEEDQKGTFPLSITLNIIEFKKWQKHKKEMGFKSDTQAFQQLVLALINE